MLQRREPRTPGLRESRMLYGLFERSGATLPVSSRRGGGPHQPAAYPFPFHCHCGSVSLDLGIPQGACQKESAMIVKASLLDLLGPAPLAVMTTLVIATITDLRERRVPLWLTA